MHCTAGNHLVLCLLHDQLRQRQRWSGLALTEPYNDLLVVFIHNFLQECRQLCPEYGTNLWDAKPLPFAIFLSVMGLYQRILCLHWFLSRNDFVRPWMLILTEVKAWTLGGWVPLQAA